MDIYNLIEKLAFDVRSRGEMQDFMVGDLLDEINEFFSHNGEYVFSEDWSVDDAIDSVVDQLEEAKKTIDGVIEKVRKIKGRPEV